VFSGLRDVLGVVLEDVLSSAEHVVLHVLIPIDRPDVKVKNPPVQLRQLLLQHVGVAVDKLPLAGREEIQRRNGPVRFVVQTHLKSPKCKYSFPADGYS
jgi:hypothetical protein